MKRTTSRARVRNASASATRGEGRLTRRDLLQLFGIGIGSAAGAVCFGEALGPERAAAENGTTSAPGVSETAFELEYDVERMFRFVAGEIAYEPYAGLLRGANGTLWGLAGNSVDQALLLAAMLDESLITYRFAVGELQPGAISALAEAVRTGGATARSRLGLAIDRSLRTVATEPAAAATPEVEQAIAGAEQLIKAAMDHVDRRASDLSQTLARAGVKLPEPRVATIPDLELRQHIWVQYASGTDWIDLDPSIPGANPGESFTTAVKTLDALPPEYEHRVKIALVAEEVVSGLPERRQVTSYEAASAELAGIPLMIVSADQNAFRQTGLAISELFTGDSSVVLSILAGADGSYSDRPIVFGTNASGTDVFGTSVEAGPGEGEALALYLTIDVTSPDAPPIQSERIIFDRIGAEARTSGVIDLTVIPPVEILTRADGSRVFPPLASSTVLDVSVTRMPNTIALLDDESQQFFGGMHVLGPNVSTLRDGLGLDRGANASWVAYPDRPNVIAIDVIERDPTASRLELEIHADLLVRSSAWQSLTEGISSFVHPGVLFGVVEQVAEEISLAPLVSAPGDTFALRAGPTVGRMFDAALDQGVSILVVEPQAEDALPAYIPAQSKRLIVEAMRKERIVVLPEHAIDLDGERVTGWWEVDLATGQVADRLGDGRAGASLLAINAFGDEMPGYARLAAWVVRNKKAFSCLGNAAGAGFALGAAAVATGSARTLALLSAGAAIARAIGACAG